jgi:hypothetical protein
VSTLTVDRLREVLNYDPETGKFTWLRRSIDQLPTVCHGKIWNVRWAGMVAGSLCKEYLAISIDKRLHKAHRLAFLWMTGKWPENEVDHINGKKVDNRWVNLRDVDHRTNSQNSRRARSNNKSTGLLGAYFDKSCGRFSSTIYVDGKWRWLGYFETAEAAHSAYVKAKRELHEGCTI